MLLNMTAEPAAAAHSPAQPGVMTVLLTEKDDGVTNVGVPKPPLSGPCFIVLELMLISDWLARDTFPWKSGESSLSKGRVVVLLRLESSI